VNTVKKVRKQARDWEKILVKYIIIRVLMSKMYEELGAGGLCL
jgi:hypothetical protein